MRMFYFFQNVREKARTLVGEVQTLNGGSTPGLEFAAPHPLVNVSSGDCSPEWKSWPSVQAAGANGGTFLVFRLFDAVGNLFIALDHLLRVRIRRVSVPLAV